MTKLMKQCACLIAMILAAGWVPIALAGFGSIPNDPWNVLAQVRAELLQASENTTQIEQSIRFEASNAVSLEQRITRGERVEPAEITAALGRTNDLENNLGKTRQLVNQSRSVLRDLASTPNRLRSPQFTTMLTTLMNMADDIVADLSTNSSNLEHVKAHLQRLAQMVG